MNLYSRALRHIDMDDVKRRREDKIVKQKIVEEVTKNIVKEVREELRNLNNPEFSNWRWDLKEGMTTAALSTTTLPATGDTDISQVDGYESIFATNGGTLSGTDLSYSVRDTDSVRIITGANSTYSRSASTSFIDTRRITQVKFSVSKTAQPLGVDSWTDAGDGENYDDTITIYMYSNGADLSLEDSSVTFTSNATTGDYTFDIPERLRGRTDVQIGFQQFALASLPGEPTSGTAAATFYTPTFQRTVPVTLVVSLDDPEASAFIRTEPTTSNLSPAQKEKRLKEMIAASDEYLAKQFGDQFPGTGAVAPKEVAMPKTFAQMKLDKDVAWLKSMGKGFTQGYLSGLSSSEANAIRRAMGMPVSKSSNPLNDMPDYERAWLQQMGPAFTQGYLGMQPKAPSTPPANASKPQVSPETLANIEASLKQLEIDKQKDKEAALRRNLEFAGNLAMDALTLASILSPVPGDEAAILAARGGTQVAKQAARTTLRTTPGPAQVTKKGAEFGARMRNQVAKEYGVTTSRQGGKTFRTTPKRTEAPLYNSSLFNSYEPQGQVLSEKKLKSPKEILNKIPGYYDGKPAPLGFPETPPPEMKNGMHPDLVDGKKVADRFNKMDPQSAKAMPLTGNPHIDKKVKAARKKSK